MFECVFMFTLHRLTTDMGLPTSLQHSGSATETNRTSTALKNCATYCAKIWIVATRFLKNRCQAVVVNGATSKDIQIVRGVLQSSVLGPLLFIVALLHRHQVVQIAVLATYANNIDFLRWYRILEVLHTCNKRWTQYTDGTSTIIRRLMLKDFRQCASSTSSWVKYAHDTLIQEGFQYFNIIARHGHSHKQWWVFPDAGNKMQSAGWMYP